MDEYVDLLPRVMGVAKALLIGILIGAQREINKAEDDPRHGIRDFILIALAGSLCGLFNHPVLTATTLGAITAVLGLAMYLHPQHRGRTTSLAALASFLLAYGSSASPLSAISNLAVGLSIVVVVALASKDYLHRLVRETISSAEAFATLRFLATIFLIYPLLPPGAFGPANFFVPRTIWMFVILVSAVSYFGYFLLKFLGAGRGVMLMAALGGIASTTAATLSFSRLAADRPSLLSTWWRAGLLANTMQFPRLLFILTAVEPRLAQALAPPLLVMTLVGGGLTVAVGLISAPALNETPPPQPNTAASPPTPAVRSEPTQVGNPFAFGPALKFGVLFTVVTFIAKVGTVHLGGGTIYYTSVLAGSVEVDAVSLSLAELLTLNTIDEPTATLAVLLTLLSNGILKGLFGLVTGSWRFAVRMLLGFTIIFGAGFCTLLFL